MKGVDEVYSMLILAYLRPISCSLHQNSPVDYIFETTVSIRSRDILQFFGTEHSTAFYILLSVEVVHLMTSLGMVVWVSCRFSFVGNKKVSSWWEYNDVTTHNFRVLTESDRSTPPGVAESDRSTPPGVAESDRLTPPGVTEFDRNYFSMPYRSRPRVCDDSEYLEW